MGSGTLHGVKYAGSPFIDVDVQVLSLNSITYFNDLPVDQGVAYARAYIDALVELAAKHPGRLVQDVGAAVEEARRAVRSLGMSGSYVHTDPAGRTLDDPALDPLYEALVDLDVPLFVHPSPLGSAGPADDVRLRRFDLDLTFGFAYEETLAVAALEFGGVLERHPGLDVCVSHGGGAAAFISGRFARAVEKRPWASRAHKENGLDHYYRWIWFDGWGSGPGEAPDDELGAPLSANATRLLRL